MKILDLLAFTTVLLVAVIVPPAVCRLDKPKQKASNKPEESEVHPSNKGQNDLTRCTCLEHCSSVIYGKFINMKEKNLKMKFHKCIHKNCPKETITEEVSDTWMQCAKSCENVDISVPDCLGLCCKDTYAAMRFKEQVPQAPLFAEDRCFGVGSSPSLYDDDYKFEWTQQDFDDCSPDNVDQVQLRELLVGWAEGRITFDGRSRIGKPEEWTTLAVAGMKPDQIIWIPTLNVPSSCDDPSGRNEINGEVEMTRTLKEWKMKGIIHKLAFLDRYCPDAAKDFEEKLHESTYTRILNTIKDVLQETQETNATLPFNISDDDVFLPRIGIVDDDQNIVFQPLLKGSRPIPTPGPIPTPNSSECPVEVGIGCLSYGGGNSGQKGQERGKCTVLDHAWLHDGNTYVPEVYDGSYDFENNRLDPFELTSPFLISQAPGLHHPTETYNLMRKPPNPWGMFAVLSAHSHAAADNACTGTLISPFHILTNAGCTWDPKGPVKLKNNYQVIRFASDSHPELREVSRNYWGEWLPGRLAVHTDWMYFGDPSHELAIIELGDLRDDMHHETHRCDLPSSGFEMLTDFDNDNWPRDYELVLNSFGYSRLEGAGCRDSPAFLDPNPDAPDCCFETEPETETTVWVVRGGETIFEKFARWVREKLGKNRPTYVPLEYSTCDCRPKQICQAGLFGRAITRDAANACKNMILPTGVESTRKTRTTTTSTSTRTPPSIPDPCEDDPLGCQSYNPCPADLPGPIRRLHNSGVLHEPWRHDVIRWIPIAFFNEAAQGMGLYKKRRFRTLDGPSVTHRSLVGVAQSGQFQGAVSVYCTQFITFGESNYQFIADMYATNPKDECCSPFS